MRCQKCKTIMFVNGCCNGGEILFLICKNCGYTRSIRIANIQDREEG